MNAKETKYMEKFNSDVMGIINGEKELKKGKVLKKPAEVIAETTSVKKEKAPKKERTPEQIQADKEKMSKIRAMRKPKATS